MTMTFAEFAALVFSVSVEYAESLLRELSQDELSGGLVHAALLGIEISDAADYIQQN